MKEGKPDQSIQQSQQHAGQRQGTTGIKIRPEKLDVALLISECFYIGRRSGITRAAAPLGMCTSNLSAP